MLPRLPETRSVCVDRADSAGRAEPLLWVQGSLRSRGRPHSCLRLPVPFSIGAHDSRPYSTGSGMPAVPCQSSAQQPLAALPLPGTQLSQTALLSAHTPCLPDPGSPGRGPAAVSVSCAPATLTSRLPSSPGTASLHHGRPGRSWARPLWEA